MVKGEKRSEMMLNLFGDNSEEEEIESEHECNRRQPNYASDEAEGGVEPEGEGEAEVEVHGEAEAESDGEQGDVELDPGESEGEREQSSQEADPQEESEARDSDSDNKEEEHGGRVAKKRRQEVVESGSERSGEKHYESEDEEVDQTRSPSVVGRSPSEEKEEVQVAQSDVNIRNVFGSSDDEDAEEYVRNDVEQDEHRSPIEDEEGSEKDLRPDDMVLDDIIPEEDPQYESEAEHVEARYRERPVGPPLEVEVPFRPPPGDPVKMNMIKVSNIMGIDPKPFDAKTFVEEDTFMTDEPGAKNRIRLDNNIVRHRFVKSRDGKTYSESNARFVRWSDGSLQLLIGNEVLNITEQDAKEDQNHLFIKHEKGILQSQGRILKKMRFTPSSLTSNSHRLLTAIVESRQKKAFKVKNCVTDIDPEREKEKREKAESQNLKASTKLSQAREKIKRKYPLPVERRQLSTGYLEDALDEDDEDYRSNRGYEEDLEAEAQRERRILNAKKSHKGIPGRSSMTSARPSRRQMEYSESEREESEYETEEEEEEKSPARGRGKDSEDEYEEDAEEDEEERGKSNRYSDEDEEEEEVAGGRAEKDHRGSGRKRKGIESDEEESPPRKAPTHRRKAVIDDSDED